MSKRSHYRHDVDFKKHYKIKIVKKRNGHNMEKFSYYCRKSYTINRKLVKNPPKKRCLPLMGLYLMVKFASRFIQEV